MRILNTIFESVKLIEPKVFEDNRGFFMETYQIDKLKELGINEVFVQDNHSLSKSANTLRGMHFQKSPMSQSKLVRVTQGSVKNIVVDIRKNSPSYLQYGSFELSAENRYILYIPKGFANGMLTLEDNTEILYKVDRFYSPEHDRSFKYDDAAISIDWGIENPILSDRDKDALLLSQLDNDFVFGENS